MIPVSRTALPRWEVSAEAIIIGWVQEHRIGRSTVIFYKAFGIHPETHQIVNLENSTDRDERVRIILEFHERPEMFSQHIW